MAIKKGKDYPQQEIDIDPAVAVHLQNETQTAADRKRQKEAGLTAYQRRKRKFDQDRVKDTYDLTNWVKERVKEIAANESVPKSHLADFLLLYFPLSWDRKKVHLLVS